MITLMNRTVWICTMISFILFSTSGWGENDFLFLEQMRVIHETAFKNSSEGKLVLVDGRQGYSFDAERKQLRYNLDPNGGYAFVTGLDLDMCEAILGRTIVFDGMKRYQRAKLVSFDLQNRIQQVDSYVPLDLFHGQNIPLSQDRVEIIQIDVDGTVTLLYKAEEITLIPGQSTQFEQKLSFPIQQQLLEGQPELVREMYKNVVSVSYVVKDTFTNWGWISKINMTNERHPQLVGDILYYVSERGNQYNFYQYDLRTQVTQHMGTITDPLLDFDASRQLIVGIRDNNLRLYALDLLSLNKLDIEPKVDLCRVWNSQILWRDEEGNLYLYDAQSGEKKDLGLATIRITPQIYQNYIVWEESPAGKPGGVENIDLLTLIPRSVTIYDINTEQKRTIPLEAPDPEDNIAPGMPSPTIFHDRQLMWFTYQKNDLESLTLLNVLNVDTGAHVKYPIPGTHDVMAPQADGQMVVWQGVFDNLFTIYLYDLRTQQLKRLSEGQGNCYYPDIANGKVVWQSDKEGNYNIYIYDLQTGAIQPIPVE